MTTSFPRPYKGVFPVAPTEEREREMTIAAHQRIVDGIADGNAEAASAAMREVIFNGLRRHGAAG